MNERLQALKQRSAASNQSVQATLQKTAPKATLGGIKAAAEKKFGQRKTTKKQQQPKKQQPKKQPKPKAVSSDVLDQWQQAMEKANIPKHRWRKLEDRISRLTGVNRKRIEDILFDHKLFEAVYSIGEDEPELVDDYLSELEARVNELSEETTSLDEMIDSILDLEIGGDSILADALTKQLITGEQLKYTLANIYTNTGVKPMDSLRIAIYSTDEIAAQGTNAQPVMDIDFNKNAIKSKYGIDISTPEGQDKFNDLLVFEALNAANKQNSSVKKIETLDKLD